MKPGKLKILLLLAGAMIFNSCKQDKVFGDITPNTERPIIEFSEPSGFASVAVDYGTNFVDLDVATIRFMIRTYVTANATAKIIVTPGVVFDYNDNNGTTYSEVPASLFTLVNNEFTLTATERSKTVRIHIKPSDIASGQNAIGLSIAEVSGGEVSRIAGTLVIAVSVKNKYDGLYHMKGFYKRTDAVGAPYNGPFETDVAMITTGPNSVAMYSDEEGGFTQPFFNTGSLFGFTNVGPEIFLNASDQIISINNYTGDPSTGPFMTLFPGANNRYVPGAAPTIYLKYYYNGDPNNRVFSDTLVYTGPR
jgi:Domain of unknown function (DUF1735)